jgi:hypothetical protein
MSRKLVFLELVDDFGPDCKELLHPGTDSQMQRAKDKHRRLEIIGVRRKYSLEI